ncbi:hypothetical protein HHK36_009998 [Tetracentron sinense]|uniref:Uncharacterized protein n=1 Tax=Tetracentron sinense TaxID=13715 RepID=A0A834ZGS2_TETSI|nr:hypothetical protein HHK36_009998 [Tetracentron sinense]
MEELPRRTLLFQIGFELRRRNSSLRWVVPHRVVKFLLGFLCKISVKEDIKGFMSRMLHVEASISDNEDDVEYYSFAMEYHGPPVTYDLPRAVPIDIERIPTAAVVAATSLSDKLSFPVVQPLITPDPLNRKFSKELAFVSEATVSPTSVIAFEQRAIDSHDLSELSSSEALQFSNDHDQSCKLSDVANTSGALGSSNDHDHSLVLSGGIESSGTLGFSNILDESHGLSGSSGPLGFSNDCKESVDFLNDLNPLDWDTTESALSSQFMSSEVSSFKAEDCNNEHPCDVKRASTVTFCDTESSDTDSEEFSCVEAEIIQERKESKPRVTKGSCYRCSKGNRFTEKEVCIVCNAKYCGNCVLRAMGSMPEGRKCVTCIGFPIDESKRGSLGKCSWMLKRLLSDLEIQQIMKSEKLCETNQLQPDHVCVNGKLLGQEELISLQSCPNPPKKLKPGNYWYDVVSGFWGKEGQKPCQIISPNLNVGGSIKASASNGNTQVRINGREITKAELRMLRMAGVQCAGNPHFWVNADGSYLEEGQKKIKGHIWGKAGMKLVCAFFSLPNPSKAANACEEEVNNLASKGVPDYLEQRTLQKLLLVGCNGSGTSTIFKQAKILYQAVPFSEDERQNIKLSIQSNVYNYLGILLEGRERFEEESLTEMRKEQCFDQSSPLGNANERDNKTIYYIGPRQKAFSDWLLKVMVSGNLEAIFPAATREYAPLVEELWKDTAIQATYSRRSEIEMLPSVASYFLERIVDISRADYEPSDVDILHAEGITSSNGLACMDFSFPQSAHDDIIDTADQHDPLLRYQLIRLHARSLGENCKWLEMFEDVRIVMFCVSLSEYNQFCDDGNGAAMNKMLATKKFFESIVTHPTFDQMDFLLILTNFDMLEEMIGQVPITQCDWFNDFNPVISNHISNNSNNNSPSLAQLASYYIAVKFKRFFFSLTGRKLYVSLVNGLESNTVDESLRYAREILKWDEERAYYSINSEYSIYSTEASS